MQVLKDGLETVHVPYAYGFAIILLTVIVKVATFPLTKQQVKNWLFLKFHMYLYIIGTKLLLILCMVDSNASNFRWIRSCYKDEFKGLPHDSSSFILDNHFIF